MEKVNKKVLDFNPILSKEVLEKFDFINLTYEEFIEKLNNLRKEYKNDFPLLKNTTLLDVFQVYYNYCYNLIRVL